MLNIDRLKRNICSIACAIISGASWITNIGWLRVFLFIPMFIHTMIFFIVNCYYNKWRKPSKVDYVNYAFCITYLLSYILLPDFGDTGESYRAVFGLVGNMFLLDIFWYVSLSMFPVNIVLMIIQVIYAFRIKREIKAKDKAFRDNY